MNTIENLMCFVGGANLDILKKCQTEKNGFIATGIGIINVAVLSVFVMSLNINRFLNGNVVLSLILSLFYGFIVFIGYWGIFSVVRRTKYSIFIIFYIFIAIVALSSIDTISILALSSIDIFNSFSKFENYTMTFILIVFTVMVCVHSIPLILKLLIYSTAYEAEKENMERKFLTRKEADTLAYNQKYGGYALQFSDANLKMESIKHLSDLSKEYHEVLTNIQKETFDFLNNLDKTNEKQKELLENCKNSVENQLKAILEKMSNIFNGI